MAINTSELHNMIELLQEEDKKIVYDITKRLVMMWDPDYTRVTEEEAKEIEEGRRELENGEYVKFEDIDWD